MEEEGRGCSSVLSGEEGREWRSVKWRGGERVEQCEVGESGVVC